MGGVSDKFAFFGVDEAPLPAKFKQPIPYATPDIGKTVVGVDTSGGGGGPTSAMRKKYGRNLAEANYQKGKR